MSDTHVFIFRRDLRLTDNSCLEEQVRYIKEKGGGVLLPVFIFNPKQIDPKYNQYYSKNSAQFLIESIQDLDKQLQQRLLMFEDEDDCKVLASLVKKTKVASVAFNEDITPFARARDATIKAWCNKQNIHCISNTRDYVLIDPQSMPKPYQVFGAYYKKYVESLKEITTREFKGGSYLTAPPFKPSAHQVHMSDITKYYGNDPNPDLAVQGGRDRALEIVRAIAAKRFEHYDNTREFPADDAGTTKLSAYLKCGCVSVREAAQAAIKAYGHKSSLVREFMFRSFYDQVVYHFQRTLEGQLKKDGYNRSLREKYDGIKWKRSSKHLAAWKNGMTGFPLVDAGMRQLNQTGYMHNRVRMVVASFLVKDLMIDWREGERYFATRLVDYYPSANNQGWTFASGSGADAQQYNRVFNPWIQSFKFDKDCEYIKRWVPELADVPAKDIHKNSVHNAPSYPKPIVDHATATKEMKQAYKDALY